MGVESVKARIPSRHTPWSEKSLEDIMEHVLRHHHAYLKAEVPRLSEMVASVAVFSPRAPRRVVERLSEVIAEFESELFSHLKKEENVLFPFIGDCERASESGMPKPQAPAELSLAGLRVMEAEHQNIRLLLQTMRTLTSYFRTPAGAGSLYRSLMERLRILDEDMATHIRLESDVLMARAVLLAPEVCGYGVDSIPS